MSYVKHIANKSTPQSEKAREDQVENTAGGFTFAIDDWKRLERFLIIGNEGGTYYATERKLTVENYDTIKRLLSIDDKRVVNIIVTISNEGPLGEPNPATNNGKALGKVREEELLPLLQRPIALYRSAV